MEILKLFILSLTFTIAFGLVFGIFLHYINLSLLKFHSLKIYYSIIITWLILAIIHFSSPVFFNTEAFQGIFSIIVVLGVVSIYKYYKSKRKV
jgi:hypothetical protein